MARERRATHPRWPLAGPRGYALLCRVFARLTLRRMRTTGLLELLIRRYSMSDPTDPLEALRDEKKSAAGWWTTWVWIISGVYLFSTTNGVSLNSLSALIFLFGGMFISVIVFGMGFYMLSRLVALTAGALHRRNWISLWTSYQCRTYARGLDSVLGGDHLHRSPRAMGFPHVCSIEADRDEEGTLPRLSQAISGDLRQEAPQPRITMGPRERLMWKMSLARMASHRLQPQGNIRLESRRR
jgi:hypothetical protein